MKKRSLLTMLVLTFVTAFIYQLYWYCSFQNQLKKKTGLGFTWLGHLVVTIVTFGIYGIYWNYACGKRLAKLGAQDYSVIYLVLGLFAFPNLVLPFLKQWQANQLR